MSADLFKAYNVNDVRYDSPLGNSDHKIITASPTSPATGCISPNCFRICDVYDFRQSNIDFLMHVAGQVDWEKLVEYENVDDKYQSFENCLKGLLQQCIPCKKVSMTMYDKEWITPLIKVLINERWEAYRTKNWAAYNHLKKKVKFEIMKAKSSWAKSLQSGKHGVWRLVRHVSSKNRKPELSSLIKRFGSVEALLSGLFDHFSKISSVQVARAPVSFNSSTEEIVSQSDFVVSEVEIKRILLKTPLGKAPGCDGLPNKFYSILADFISKPLAVICQASFSQGKFPSGWKKGLIIPVPKQNVKSIADVRPITLHPLPAKICEKVIKSRYESFFEAKYGANQHGFRKNASTTTALIHLMDVSLRNVDQELSSGNAIISLDLSKAFDSLDHRIILTKLQGYGFPGALVGWLRDYLQSRTARIKMDNNVSDAFEIQRGVPQGTVLGPLIFNTFVSDFEASLIDSTVVKYADDMSEYCDQSIKERSGVYQSVDRTGDL